MTHQAVLFTRGTVKPTKVPEEGHFVLGGKSCSRRGEVIGAGSCGVNRGVT